MDPALRPSRRLPLRPDGQAPRDQDPIALSLSTSPSLVEALSPSIPYHTYIVFSTVANPRQTGEDTYSKYSASASVPALKKLKQNDLVEYRRPLLRHSWPTPRSTTTRNPTIPSFILPRPIPRTNPA